MRTKRLTTIENEIHETKDTLLRLQNRCSNLEVHLEELYEQKRKVQEKNLFAKFISSGKSWSDVMNFFNTSVRTTKPVRD